MAQKKPNVSEERFNFGPWSICACTGPILTSADDERIKNELDIPALPEMFFGKTCLQITHDSGFELSFNTFDAMRLVDNKHDKMKVACAQEWQQQRETVGVMKEVAKPFDWTYTTDYKGTLTGGKEVETTERIDLEKLKRHEKIHFYQDMLLFEDELGDNGITKLNVKMRVMPSSFFVLLRFYLRVDDVLVRINDTRIYHEAGTDYILREYSSKEKSIKALVNPNDEVGIADQLDLVTENFMKLDFSGNIAKENSVE